MKVVRSIFLYLFTLCFCFQSSFPLSAQVSELAKRKGAIVHDTNYIETFPDHITSRIYLSRKFTGIRMEAQPDDRALDYQPNTTVNLGIGATVKGFTLNLAYGFDFLNQNESRGLTRYLDLQSHFYGRTYAADLFGQFYFGMYLANSEATLNFLPDSFYLRPDLSVILLGGSYYRVHSPEKFSYAASLVQNEWQKKSAGSFLWGGKVLLMGAVSDSSLIPTFSSDSVFDAFAEANRLSSFQFGPGVGYAHTFVVDQHWFFTFSLELNIMIGPTQYSGPELVERSEWQVNPAADLKFALGYNSLRSYFGVLYVQNNAQVQSFDESVSAIFSVGNVRLNYVKRFKMGPKLKKTVNKMPF